MADDDSVTHWIDGIKAGRSTAAGALWNRYFERLVRLARRKLQDAPRRVADEHDVAASALASFCRAARSGRFPELADRDSLWRLLLSMTSRKAVDLIRYNDRAKRRAYGESVLFGATPEGEVPGVAQVLGDGPTPEFAAVMAEECQRLLDLLGNSDLQALAVAKMEGDTNRELAKRFECSERTIERQLSLIRKKWQKEVPE